MEAKEFYELCQTAKPVSVICDEPSFIGSTLHDMTIVFDNGIEVSVSTETEYDSPYFSLETNIEREAWERELDKRLKTEQQEREEKKQKLAELKASVTPEVWAEMVKMRIVNP